MMMNKIIPVIIVLAAIIGFFYLTNAQNVSSAICGNKICEVSEDCNSCQVDCGCKQNQYCSLNGLCRANVCGDGICSEQEKTSAKCCEDCNCSSVQICNKFTQQCQEKTTITKTQINNIVNTYLMNKSINGTITKIIDTYYANDTVKQVAIDCKPQNLPYPCQIILFVDNNGNIIKEEKTV